MWLSLHPEQYNFYQSAKSRGKIDLSREQSHHTALILQELAVYEKEPASVVKVTEEGDLNIMENDDNEAEYDLKN